MPRRRNLRAALVCAGASTSAGLQLGAASSAAPLSALSSPLTASRAGVFMAAEAAAEERVIKRLERRRIMGEERYKRGGAPFDKEIHKDVVGKMSDKFKSEVIEQMKESPFRELVRGEGAKQVTFQLAQEYGFCWGVERSIELAWAARDAYPENTMHITNELIHNPGVNDMLHDMDVQFIEKDTTTGGKRFEDVGDGDVVILPAFGASLEEMQLLDEKGVTVVDTTCPWVSKVWTVVDKHQKADMTCVIHGKYAHEEAIATASMCEEYIIVKNIDEAGLLAAYILDEPGALTREEILEKFVEWFDANAVGEKFDGFIRENAGDFAGASSEGEQELSRMELYKRYQAVFDELLQTFVTHASITQAEFLEAARSADGLHDAYLNIFLAHAEYDVR